MRVKHFVGLLLIFSIEVKLSLSGLANVNYWGTFCRSRSYDPSIEIDWFNNTAECIGHCIKNPVKCRVATFDGKICALYDIFSPRVFSICSDGLGTGPQADYYARFQRNERFLLLTNAAGFKPVLNASMRGYTGDLTPCFNAPTDTSVVDGIVQYDVDLLQGKECGVWAHYYNAKPWLRIDLLSIYTIDDIVLYNVGNGYESLLHDIQLRVGMLDFADNPIMDHQPKILEDTICATQLNKLVPAGPSVFRCQTMPIGRFVTLQIVAKCTIPGCRFIYNKIAVIEFEVWATSIEERNLAFQKPVTGSLSSTDLMLSKQLVWNYAVDGYRSYSMYERNRLVAYDSGAFNSSSFPWLQIDLMDVFAVKKIILYNVEQKEPGYLHDIEVRVGMDSILMNQDITQKLVANKFCLLVKDILFPPGRVEITCIEDVVGTYVTIQIVKKCEVADCNSTHNRLLLSEVEVIGKTTRSYDELTNVALGKMALQSSTMGLANADFAVDGNARLDFYFQGKPQCTMTKDTEKYPWWRVDLVDEYIVVMVNIFNRNEDSAYLHDIFIEVGNYDIEKIKPENYVFRKNALCLHTLRTTLASGMAIFHCNKTARGNFVNIQIVRLCTDNPCKSKFKNVLSLCEVEVHGASIPVFKPKLSNLAYDHYLIIQQSTVKGNLNARLTTDGFTDSTSFSCASTSDQFGEDTYPWWRAESVDEIMVEKVVMYNKYGHEHKRLHDIQIRIGYEDIANLPLHTILNKNPICANLQNYALAGEISFSCSTPLMGRFVSIQIVQFCTHEYCTEPNLNVLILCEVQVWGYQLENHIAETLKNEAIYRPVTQSTSHPEAIAELAVDGITSSVLYNGAEYKCTKTDEIYETYPWWRVDMLHPVEVHLVEIYNIGQNLQSKLHDFAIRVGNDDIASFPFNTVFIQNYLCAQVLNKTFSSGLLTFLCYKPVVGRYASIQIIKHCLKGGCVGDTKNVLYLCEVLVWASKAPLEIITNHKNIAVHQLTMQSSTKGSSVSKLAVDGVKIVPKNTDELFKLCASTEEQQYAWWLLKLDTMYTIYKVGFFYRESSLQDPNYIMEVRIGNISIEYTPKERFVENSYCGTFTDDFIPLSLNEMECSTPIIGKYVSIQLLPTCGDYYCYKATIDLTICEFETYGEKYYLF